MPQPLAKNSLLPAVYLTNDSVPLLSLYKIAISSLVNALSNNITLSILPLKYVLVVPLYLPIFSALEPASGATALLVSTTVPFLYKVMVVLLASYVTATKYQTPYAR